MKTSGREKKSNQLWKPNSVKQNLSPDSVERVIMFGKKVQNLLAEKYNK